jgi:L-fuconolactonase
MYGGDWPISVLSGGYDRVWGGLSELFNELPELDRDNILGRTATDFYRIDQSRIASAAGLKG